MVSTLIFILLLDYLGYENTSKKEYLLLFAILILLMLNFYKLKITITNEYFDFRFGLIGNKIRIKDIQQCEVVDITFKNYLGAGIRYGFDGTLAYNTRFGKAVRLKVKDRKRDYVITTNEPERICRLLK
jgi:hypothetical protein